MSTASGFPFVTWDGADYVVRVDFEPDDAEAIAVALERDGRGAEGEWFRAAADRVRRVRKGRAG